MFHILQSYDYENMQKIFLDLVAVLAYVLMQGDMHVIAIEEHGLNVKKSSIYIGS